MRMGMYRAVMILPLLLFCACSSKPVVVRSGILSIMTQPLGVDLQADQKTVGRSPLVLESPIEDVEG